MSNLTAVLVKRLRAANLEDLSYGGLLDLLNEAADAIEALTTWQEIGSAPKDGTWIWAFYPANNAERYGGTYEDQFAVAKWVEDWGGHPGWMDAAEHRDFDQPTYWRHLPAPPSPASKEGRGE